MRAGRSGIFHWTDIGYDSALRWWRSSRFLAEKGMGITVGVGLDVREQLTLLAPGGEAPHFITLERRWERVDGGALVAMVAHTGDPDLPIVQWENPFRPQVQGHGQQWHDDEIGVAGCLLSLVNAVRGGHRADLWTAPGAAGPGNHPGHPPIGPGRRRPADHPAARSGGPNALIAISTGCPADHSAGSVFITIYSPNSFTIHRSVTVIAEPVIERPRAVIFPEDVQRDAVQAEFARLDFGRLQAPDSRSRAAGKARG